MDLQRGAYARWNMIQMVIENMVAFSSKIVEEELNPLKEQLSETLPMDHERN